MAKSRSRKERTAGFAEPATFNAKNERPAADEKTVAAPARPSAAAGPKADPPATRPETAALLARSADPTHEQIVARARALWQASGCPAGRDVENWIDAERQLRAELRSR